MNVAEYRQLAAKAMSEDDLTGQILDLATGLGWTLTYHVPDSRRTNPGFPDWVLLNPTQRRIIYAELKTETGRIRPGQRQWIGALAGAGQEIYVWRPSDLLAGRVLDTLREGGDRP